MRTTIEEREDMLKKTDYNVFNFPAAFTVVDLLSDSGSGALTQHSWMSMFLGDEAYARNNWYYAFLEAFRDFVERGDDMKKSYMQLLDIQSNPQKFLNEFVNVPKTPGTYVNPGLEQLENPNAFILPQGRCCEYLLFSNLMSLCQAKKAGNYKVLSNGFFDTTRANAKIQGFEVLDLFDKDIEAPYPLEDVGPKNPFRGNINLEKLEEILKKDSEHVALIVITLTNNTGAGQPVSMKNIKAVRELSLKYNTPVWFDSARVHENSGFIQMYEEGYSTKSIPEINKETYENGDGFHISMKKALSNIGGFLSIKDGGLVMKQHPTLGKLLKKNQIIIYGNDSYGALSGKELAAATMGLYEAMDEDYLATRISNTMYCARGLAKRGVPVVLPPGGHAIFINNNLMFPERKWDDFAGAGFVSELLRRYGIRGCELGYMAWELDVYVEKHGKMPEIMPPNLVRFAIPGNVYHKEHFDYFIKCVAELYDQRDEVPNVEITRGKYDDLRHFTVGFKIKK